MTPTGGRPSRLAAAAIALAVLVPCGAWWVAGRSAVLREAAVLEREAWSRVRERADAVAARAARRLEALRAGEAARPWRHWSHRWVENDPSCDCPAPRTSPLLRAEDLPREILGWFEVGPDGAVRIVRAGRDVGEDVAALGRPLAASLAVAPESDEIVEPESWTEAPDGAVLAPGTELVAQGPFQWRSVAVAGVPCLAAVREVRTTDGARVQGFVVDPVVPAVDGDGGDRLVHGPRQAPGEAELPLAGTVWRAVVDPTPDLARARDAAEGARRRFVRGFALGAGAAVVAGALGLVLLRQRVRSAALRERWAAAAAHELRGPLAGLRLHGDLLADRLDRPGEARQTVGTIARELHRLERLVDNVVEYGRRGRGAPPPALDTDDVGAVVLEVVTTARPLAGEFGATLDVAVEPDLPPARLHAAGLRQVLWNLIDNAARHGRGGRNVVRIEVAVRADRYGIAIEVSDDGPGLPDEVVRRALGTRVREPRPRPDGGLGIGLALSAELVRAMGGSLDYRRSDGSTRLTVRLRSDRDLILDTPD